MVKKFDPARMQALAEKMESGTGKFPMDKLDTGSKSVSNYRRFLPGHENMVDSEGYNMPVSVFPVHFSVGPAQQQVACITRLGIGECPICVYAKQLANDGDKKGASKVYPNWRGYMNVVVLNEDMTPAENTVRVLALNKTQYAGLNAVYKKYGDITDFEEGRPIDLVTVEDKTGTFTFNVITFFPGDKSAFNYPDSTGEVYDLTTAVDRLDADAVTALGQGQGTNQITNGKLPFALPSGESEEPKSSPGGFNYDETPAEAEETNGEDVPAADITEAVAKLKSKSKGK